MLKEMYRDEFGIIQKNMLINNLLEFQNDIKKLIKCKYISLVFKNETDKYLNYFESLVPKSIQSREKKHPVDLFDDYIFYSSNHCDIYCTIWIRYSYSFEFPITAVYCEYSTITTIGFETTKIINVNVSNSIEKKINNTREYITYIYDDNKWESHKKFYYSDIIV